jgi:hypothetical protein
LAVERLRSGKDIDVEEVFHSAIHVRQLDHSLELLRDHTLPGVGPEAERLHIRQGREFYLDRRGGDDIPEPDVDLKPLAGSIQKSRKVDPHPFVIRILIPFEFRCLNLLKRYLRDENLAAGPVFRTGKEKARRMTYEAALYQWGSICREAGVAFEIHQLRHSAATLMLNEGVGIGTVRRLLGHKNL